MPFTPFHFGPGAAIHAAAPRHVSFLAFCAANVLIDVEPLYYMLTGQYPLHRFFHTYIGDDIAPFAPFSDANPLLHLVSLATLHWTCAGVGAVALVVLLVRDVS